MEIELNGTMTYDRKVRNPWTPTRIRAAIASAAPSINLTTVLPTSRNELGRLGNTGSRARLVRYGNEIYNDAGWTNGPAASARAIPQHRRIVRTAWNTSDIWLRRTFNPGSLMSQQISNRSSRFITTKTWKFTSTEFWLAARRVTQNPATDR